MQTVLTDDIAAQAEGLIDRALVEAAQAALAAAEVRQVKAQGAAARAEIEHRAAREAVAQMIESGDLPTLAAATAAGERVERAGQYASMLGAIARRLAVPVEEAQVALTAARRVAWAPVIAAAIARRISVAARVDRARLAGQWGQGDTPMQIALLEGQKNAAIAALRPEWDAANALLSHAEKNGGSVGDRYPGDRQTWPPTEARERAYFNRPVSFEEAANAA